MAVRIPNVTSPIDGVGVDATNPIDVAWEFQADAGETQDSYQVIIYLMTDGSISHDSGVVSSSSEIYTIPSSTLINGNTYFGTVSTTSGAVTKTTRIPFTFNTLTTPTLTIDPLGAVGQFVIPTATYTQAEGVPVKTFQWRLYDNSDVLIVENPIKFGQVITDVFIGLANGVTYKLEVEVVNQNEVITISARESFVPSYTIPEDAPSIVVEGLPEKSGISVNYEDIVVIDGQVTGTTSFVAGKFNKSLKLDDGCLLWDLADHLIPRNFTSSFWAKIDPTHDGDLWLVKKGGASGDTKYRVGYDLSYGRFYLERDYRFTMSQPITLPTGYFQIGITPTTVYFISTELGNSFEFTLR